MYTNRASEINKLFNNYMAQKNIGGDITPMQQLKWNELIEEISSLITEIEEQNKGEIQVTTINENTHNEPLWKVTIGTGLAWTQQFKVYAQNEQEAIDFVADYIEDHEDYEGLWFDHYTLYDECEVSQTVDEYAEANQLVCCGNHGIYIQLLGIETAER